MSTTEYYPIVGAHFRPPAKIILQFLPGGAPLTMEREPTNEFDANAIAVYVEPSAIPEHVREECGIQATGFGYSIEDIMSHARWHLGYVPAKFATGLAPAMDLALGGPDSLPAVPATLTFDSKGKPAALPIDPEYQRQRFYPGE